MMISDHKSQKEPSEEKLKGQAVFQKGRFSVTSQDEDIQEASTLICYIFCYIGSLDYKLEN